VVGEDGKVQHASLTVLTRLWPWLRPYRGYLIFMLIVATSAMVLQSLVPVITGRLVDGPIAHHDTAGMYPLIGLVLLFGVLEAVLFGIRRRAMTTSALAIETDLRRDLYEHLQRLPVSFHDEWASGQLLSRATSDLSTLRRFVGFMAVFFVANLTVILVIGVMMFRIDPRLGLGVWVVMMPLAVLTRHYEKRYNIEARRAQDINGDLATEVEESVLGVRVIKAFGRRNQVVRTFGAGADELRHAELAKNRTLSDLWAVIGGYPQVVLAGVTFFGIVAVAHNQLSTGDLVAFIALQLRLNWPLMAMGWLIAGTEEAVAATARIFEVLDSENPIVSPTAAVALPRTRRSVRLSFDHVTFRFADADTDALSDVVLDIEPGETMALVGPTGSGKTTLTALVSRLHDVTSGAVRIDGVDVATLSLEELRSTVSVAFEDSTLFSASVRENVALGRPDATDDEIAEALRIAQASFVDDLPFGLDTRVGEQGLSLSGGQRQRIALARAVLGRPRVLVLDDPLSALDIHTEAGIERSLRSALSTTTALVVAHRASTVQLADRVALIEAGRITAVGRHSELLATNPTYRDLLSQRAAAESAGAR
jgi:ATP-binding cassette subfamily B protein